MSQLKILVLGGMHGNELLGVELVQLLKQKPIKGVSALIANPRAVTANERFTEADLNRSFGANQSPSYEASRAQYLKSYVKDFDVVLDFHNTQTPNNNCGFVGTQYNPKLLKLLKIAGLANCVEATYDCINKYCPNVVSIEISQNDQLDSIDYWYSLLQTFSFELPEKAKSLSVYRFKQRVSWQQRSDLQIANWQPFVPIADELRKNLKLNGIIVPIFIGSKLTEYYATLLSKERIT
jgi:hypothetical protein